MRITQINNFRKQPAIPAFSQFQRPPVSRKEEGSCKDVVIFCLISADIESFNGCNGGLPTVEALRAWKVPMVSITRAQLNSMDHENRHQRLEDYLRGACAQMNYVVSLWYDQFFDAKGINNELLTPHVSNVDQTCNANSTRI
jgi:hypothetical protein